MYGAIVLVALLSVAEGAINYCGAKMCGRTNEHTFCKYHGPGPDCLGYIEDRLTHDERLRVLARLNRRRSEAASGKLQQLPTAGNMLKLRWVEELAREAQLWADQCQEPSAPEGHDDCRDLFSITVGQCVSSVVGEAPGLRPESMVDTWYLQGFQYKGNVSSYTSSPKHADFGQMIWAHSFMVGCARSRFMMINNVQSEIKERTRTVIRLVCNFAPRGPAGELWLPAAPAAACPQHTTRDDELPSLCSQLNLTDPFDESNEMTIEERTVLNAVLEIERNQSLEYHGSLDEIYLTNMAIATLNHPATTESYFKTKHKQDVLDSLHLEDDKQIDKAQNSIQEIDEIISKMVREKTTKLVKRVSIVGRPKSYNIEELQDQDKEEYTKTRPVETTTLKETDLYAEYEFQDVTETTSEYDDKSTFKNIIQSTSTSISVAELNSTEDAPSTQSPSVTSSNEVSNRITTEEAKVKNHNLLRLLELSKMNEENPSDPQTAQELQEALERVESALAGETSGKVRRELRRRTQSNFPQDYGNLDMSPELNPKVGQFRDARQSDDQTPGPPESPIRTLDKTPTLNMIIKYLPFMKDYQKMMSASSSNSPCVVITFIYVCVSLGSL